jgi:hypothetical protein
MWISLFGLDENPNPNRIDFLFKLYNDDVHELFRRIYIVIDKVESRENRLDI